MLVELLALSVTGASTAAGYVFSRRFVKERLRFVDAIQRRPAPFIAGAAATAVAAPVVWLLPLVGTGTALLFGAGVGLGVARGAKDTRRGGGREVMVV